MLRSVHMCSLNVHCFCCCGIFWCQDGGDYCVPFQSPSDASTWLGAALVTCQISPHLEMRFLYFSCAVRPGFFLARSALRCKGILCQERRLLFSKSSWEPFGIPHLSWSRDVQRILEMINYGLLLSFPFSGSSLLVSRIFATFPRCAKQCTLLSS